MVTTFRPYQPSDRNRCLALFDANCPAFFAPNERDDYREFLATAPGYEVCLRDDRIIGAYGLVNHDGGSLALRWILLSPDVQGRGIGSAIMRRVTDTLRARRIFQLHIAASHKSAPFFSRFGAAALKTIPDGWGPGMDRVDMVLETMRLVWPAREYLASYTTALQRGWSPDNVRGAAAAQQELEMIAADPDAFLTGLVDREARGGPIVLADGSSVSRLPGYRRWMWDGEFCGSVGLRWQPGTEALPPQCLGHIGYSVVPWKRRLGYATRALAALLPEARAEGLRYVEITTGVDNLASQRVIEVNGGVLVEDFVTPSSLGSRRERRYRVTLMDQGEFGLHRVKSDGAD